MNEKSTTEEVAEERRIRMISITKSIFYFMLAIGLAIILALTDNFWWNIPGMMAAYSGGHYFRKAWVRRKV